LYRVISDHIADGLVDPGTDLHSLRDDLAVFLISTPGYDDEESYVSSATQLEQSGVLEAQVIAMAEVFRQFIGDMSDDIEVSPVILGNLELSASVHPVQPVFESRTIPTDIDVRDAFLHMPLHGDAD
jgi:hypothetical protein